MNFYAYTDEKSRSDAMNAARREARDLSKQSGNRYTYRHRELMDRTGYEVYQIVNPDSVYEPLGAADVTPARPGALAFAEAILELLEAHNELLEAERKVPSYTGQYSSRAYYAREEERYNRAADVLADIAGIAEGE